MISIKDKKRVLESDKRVGTGKTSDEGLEFKSIFLFTTQIYRGRSNLEIGFGLLFLFHGEEKESPGLSTKKWMFLGETPKRVLICYTPLNKKARP